MPLTVRTWFKGIDIGDTASDGVHSSAVTDAQEVHPHRAEVAKTSP
jgi:hypothetical protein